MPDLEFWKAEVEDAALPLVAEGSQKTAGLVKALGGGAPISGPKPPPRL